MHVFYSKLGFKTEVDWDVYAKALPQDIASEKWAGRCVESFERISQEKEIELLGYFSCQGAPSPPIEAFIRSEVMPDDEDIEVYLTEMRKHPNEKDMEKARKFTRAVLSKSVVTDA